MATLLQVREKANAKLATLWNDIKTRQDAYFAKHGKYFQLLASSDLTADGLDTPFSVKLPSDEVHIVDIDTSWSDTVPFRLEVHEWVGSTKGFTAIVTINYQGTLYRRQRDTNNVDSGWFQVTQPI